MRYQHLFTLLGMFLLAGNVFAQNEFITTWKTDNSGTSSSTSITIPTNGTGYNYDVDWNNDGTFDEFGLTGDVTHDFGTAGTYTIRIQGSFPTIYFSNGGDRLKLLDVSQWGTIAWSSGYNSFYGCANLTISATDFPDLSGATDVERMFAVCDSLVGTNLTNWQVGNITDFTRMFVLCGKFNGDIGAWDVSSANSMLSMFESCVDFNQSLNAWDVSACTDFTAMFRDCPSFNQDFTNWNTQSATGMYYMFYDCTSFNGDVTGFNTSGISDFQSIFYNCSVFNQDISTWDVSNGINFSNMFSDASSFNQDISSWDVGEATIMYEMFYNCSVFDQNLGGWDVADVFIMDDMFDGATLSIANYDALLIGWASQVLSSNVNFSGGNSQYCLGSTARADIISNFNWTFTDGGEDCSVLIGDFVTTWKTDNMGSSNSTSITIPTTGTGYNYDVDWDNDGAFDEFGITGNVTHDFGTAGTYTIRIRGDFPQMYFNDAGDRRKIMDISQWGNIEWLSGSRAFYGCTNLTVSATDVPDLIAATSVDRMFRDCDSLVGTNLANWDVSNVQDFTRMFEGCRLFNGDIGSWNVSSATNFTRMFYTCQAFNRDLNNWDVSGCVDFPYMFADCISLNQDFDNWNVQSGTFFRNMFVGCLSFNGDVTTWDMSNADNIRNMFSGCVQFNQDLNNWDVSQVEDFKGVFLNASAYNQPMNNWNTVSADEMDGMFQGATSFDQDLSSWNVTNVISAPDMFNGVTLSITNYDALLIGWNSQNLQPNVVFSGGNSEYCAAGTERANMIASDGWTITDGGIESVGPTPDMAMLYDITADCQVTSLIAPTATDNCASTVIVTHDATFPITAQGTTVVTWTYDDGNGNTSTQTQNIVINDITPPTPDVSALSDFYGECQVTSLTPPTATDNCSANVTVTSDAVFPITVGSVTVVWTYTDDNGNSVSQNQTIVVDDTSSAVFDQAILADVITECAVTSLTPPTATDNCSGTITGTHNASLPITTQGTTTVTWTYDDGNGNTSTQTQDVVIADITAPVADQATLTDVTAGCEVTSLTPPTATDNCTDTVIVTHDASLPITTLGTTVVTWTYVDGNGNTSTQTQNVIIDDIDVTTTLESNGVTITANNSNATSYQWINCGNGNSAIPGATNNDFVAMVNGDYAVIVTEGNCTDTSACVTVNSVGIDGLSMETFVIYPNPTNTGQFSINYEGELQKIELIDMLGRVVSADIDMIAKTVDGSSLENGKYVVRLYTDTNTVLQQQVVVIK